MCVIKNRLNRGMESLIVSFRVWPRSSAVNGGRSSKTAITITLSFQMRNSKRARRRDAEEGDFRVWRERPQFTIGAHENLSSDAVPCALYPGTSIDYSCSLGASRNTRRTGSPGSSTCDVRRDRETGCGRNQGAVAAGRFDGADEEGEVGADKIR